MVKSPARTQDFPSPGHPGLWGAHHPLGVLPPSEGPSQLLRVPPSSGGPAGSSAGHPDLGTQIVIQVLGLRVEAALGVKRRSSRLSAGFQGGSRCLRIFLVEVREALRPPGGEVASRLHRSGNAALRRASAQSSGQPDCSGGWQGLRTPVRRFFRQSLRVGGLLRGWPGWCQGYVAGKGAGPPAPGPPPSSPSSPYPSLHPSSRRSPRPSGVLGRPGHRTRRGESEAPSSDRAAAERAQGRQGRVIGRGPPGAPAPWSLRITVLTTGRFSEGYRH